MMLPDVRVIEIPTKFGQSPLWRRTQESENSQRGAGNLRVSSPGAQAAATFQETATPDGHIQESFVLQWSLLEINFHSSHISTNLLLFADVSLQQRLDMDIQKAKDMCLLL